MTLNIFSKYKFKLTIDKKLKIILLRDGLNLKILKEKSKLFF